MKNNYNPSQHGIIEIKAKIDMNGVCYASINRVNCDSWRTSKLTMTITMRLSNMILSQPQQPSHLAINPNKLNLNIRGKVFITTSPEGKTQNKFDISINPKELEQIPDWHLEKLTHYINNKLSEDAFNMLIPPEEPNTSEPFNSNKPPQLPNPTPTDKPPLPPESPEPPFPGDNPPYPSSPDGHNGIFWS